MIYSLMVIIAVGAALYIVKKWQRLPVLERKAFAQKAVLWSLFVVVVGLVVAGRAHWLMGVLAALLALVGRVAQFAQYVPMFKKVFGDESSSKNNSTSANIPVKGDMSKQDAADILGVDINANVDDIRMAHKRLMQKIHPDRGGSDALAKQINAAKSILLG